MRSTETLLYSPLIDDPTIFGRAIHLWICSLLLWKTVKDYWSPVKIIIVNWTMRANQRIPPQKVLYFGQRSHKCQTNYLDSTPSWVICKFSWELEVSFKVISFKTGKKSTLKSVYDLVTSFMLQQLSDMLNFQCYPMYRIFPKLLEKCNCKCNDFKAWKGCLSNEIVQTGKS